MQKLEVKDGRINGWYCPLCKGYLDIGTAYCLYCCSVQCVVMRDESLAVFALLVRWERLGFFYDASHCQLGD